MEIILFLFICFFQYILTQYDVILDFQPITEAINENNIIFDHSKIIIESIKTIMNEYPFINILKDPPLINEEKYFDKVDIIEELNNLQLEIEEKQINYYEYFQKYLKIIRKTNDLHLDFFYNSYKQA